MDQQGLFVASQLDASSRALAAGVVNRLIDPEHPGGGDFKERLADVESRIAHLAESLAVGTSDLFVAHVEWLRSAYRARRVPLELLEASLDGLRDELTEHFGAETHDAILAQLDAARDALRRADRTGEAPVEGGPHSDRAQRFLLAQLESRREDALVLIERALGDGISISDIEVHIIARAQAEIGQMWQRGEIVIAEEHMGSTIVEEAISLLGHRIDTPVRPDRVAMTASVAGNMHDFGARVVSHHFRLAGWRTHFMGADTPSDDILWALGQYEPNALAVSVALPLQVRTTAGLIGSIRATRRNVRIIVGGPPINAVPELWRAVGADVGSTDVQTLVADVEALLD